FERRPKDLYFGIGNNGDTPEARYREQLARGAATLDMKRTDAFHVRVAGAFTNLDFDDSKEGPPIQMLYPPSMLTGFTGTRNLYAELELRYDTRRITNTLEQMGVLADAFGGRIYQLEAGSDYWRYGGEAIHFQPLGIGRTLATRLHFESVSGSYNDVAFNQLPELGGKMLLRGYAVDRFRDRVAIASSVEYMWDISSFVLASLFVDAGRVYPALDELTFDDMRLGYGASLQLVDRRRFLAGVSVASSIDGGVFLNLVLDPIYEPEARVKQK
ncbi:MAG TPA: BamA/TamA family outer membrane protein, partial [Kofleriaceae bacterium]|nr:BamA/TamA family outer membrane protein [Kofleriaceae bacterium]